jgi:two-component system chemotaxis response regulator CheY
MRKIIKTLLVGLGFKSIVEAANGTEALHLLLKYNKESSSDYSSDHQIDLIICDWMMPGMNGLELLKQVRADEELKSIPFLMLTAEGQRESVMSALAEGVSDYAVKPFTMTMLEEKILGLLAD